MVIPQEKRVEGAVEAGRSAEGLAQADEGRLTGGRVRILRPILLVLLVATGVWAYQHFDAGSRLSFGAMRALVEAHAPYSPLVFIGIFIAGIFLRVPGIMLVVLGGILFKRPQAFAYSWIAAVVGTAASFLLARYFTRDAVRRSLLSRFARLRALDEKLERHGFVTILALRVVLFLSPPLNWAIGVTRVRFRDYFWGSAIGVIPCTAVTCYAADSIARAGSFSAILTPATILAAGLAVAFVAASAFAAFRFFR